MPFDFIPPVRLIDKTIGSAPITPGSTLARLYDATIGAPSVAPLFGLSIFGVPNNASVGDASVFAPTIAGGTAPYTLSVSAGSLPPGRSISGLTVVGTYSTAGSYSYTLRVTDSLAATADLPVSLVVSAAGASLSISGTPGQATAGTTFSFTPSASGGTAPHSFSLSGSLPGGLSFSSSTGAITGTPSAAGTVSGLSITVTDSKGATAVLGPFSIVVQASGGGAVTRASITSVNPDGWSAQDSSPTTFDPVNTPQYIVLNRQGFTSAGAATSYIENAIITKRVRVPWQSGVTLPTLDPNRVASNTYIYSTDTVAGGSSAANNSTVASPVPIAQWERPDMQTVGNTIRAEICATHRNARNNEGIACVIFSATDGTNTITQTVSQSSILNHPGDKTKVTGYAANLNISTLADNATITVNAKVYPWIGGAASVLDSSTLTAGARGFSPQVYYKNTALFATYPVAVVSPTGVDASGQAALSSNPATARNNPFLTVSAAPTALQTLGGSNGLSGAHLWLAAGTNSLGTLSGNNYTAPAGELIIEGDPSVADPTTCILTYGANFGIKVSYLRFQNMREVRTGGQAWQAGPLSGGFFTRENSSLDNTNGGSGGISSASVATRFLGFSFVGTTATSAFGVDARIMRGVVATGLTSVTGFNVVGCSLTSGVFNNNAYSDSGAFIGFNILDGLTGTAIGPAGAIQNVSGYAVVQNVMAFIYTTSSTPGFRPSGDGSAYSISHMCMFNNTMAGGGQNGGAGRSNSFYDEKQGTNRQNVLNACRGNIQVQINQKSDIFVGTDGGGTPNPTDAPNHTGAWSFYYGVDCQGEISQIVNAFGPPSDTNAATQCFTGLGSIFGNNTASIDPKFVRDQSTTPKTPQFQGTPMGGSVGGDYHTQLGSPAKSIVANAALRFDLDGATRPAANDDGGAYLVKTA